MLCHQRRRVPRHRESAGLQQTGDILFPLPTPGTMSNQGLIKRAGKYRVVFLEGITWIYFTKVFCALAIFNT